MLIRVTDPDILSQYPHLSPPKLRLADAVPVLRPESVLVYHQDPGDPQAGHGRVVRCDICKTYLRAGQTHTSDTPEPHAAYDMVTVYEPELVDEHYSGGLATGLSE